MSAGPNYEIMKAGGRALRVCIPRRPNNEREADSGADDSARRSHTLTSVWCLFVFARAFLDET